jgi:hypothetical protein
MGQTSPDGAQPTGVPRPVITQLEELATDFARQFDGVAEETEIYRLLFENFANLRRDATVHDHLVPLTAHIVAEELRRRAAAGP